MVHLTADLRQLSHTDTLEARQVHTMSSLWVINKAGGLIYQAEHFVRPEGAPQLSSNEYLVLAGTLHGIHAITARLNPVLNRRCSGLESLDAENFAIKVMVTATGASISYAIAPDRCR